MICRNDNFAGRECFQNIMKKDFIDTSKTKMVGVTQESHEGKQTLADVDNAVAGGGQRPTERRPQWRVEQRVVQEFVLLL